MRMVDRLTEWVTRERPIERKLLVAGLACLATVGVGPGWALATKVFGHDITISRIQPLPDLLSWIVGGSGAVLLMAAGLLASIRYFDDRSERGRRLVLAIEQRGLRDTTDTPLVDAIPAAIKGRRQPLIVDIRDRIKDGAVTDPEAALERVAALPRAIEPLRNGKDSADIVTVYGGLSPVPFTFLAGVLLDDESQITTLDWDRNAGVWRQLNGADDGDSFAVSGVEHIPEGATEAAVAVSVSYLVDPGAITKSFPSLPLVQLTLPRRSPDNHWSESKQQRLAKVFLAAMVRLADAGIATVHLFLAAQNSVAFRLGRSYDKRNLPRILVYQFQKGRDNEHPWAVEMPVQDVARPALRQTSSAMHDPAAPDKVQGRLDR